MGTFHERIRIDSFSIEEINVSEIDEVDNWLPANGIMDINIAEKGLIMTLHAQNICQEQIAKVDRWISIKDGNKNKAWSEAALVKAGIAGHKTVKTREWFAQADDDYIEACNELAIAKAAKKWLENKAQHFSSWHYAFKTFLKRDYGLERLGNFQPGGYNDSMNSGSRRTNSSEKVDDMCGEIKWGE
jgi:hypothetical protein